MEERRHHLEKMIRCQRGKKNEEYLKLENLDHTFSDSPPLETFHILLHLKHQH